MGARSLRIWAIIVGCLAGLALSAPAAAQSQSHFDIARAAFNSGDEKAARDNFAAACRDPSDPHAGASCFNSALLAENGRGGPKDVPSAIDLYSAGCNQHNFGRACLNLALLYDVLGRGSEQETRVLLQKACSQDLPDGCIVLGYLFRHGKGVATDKARAEEFYQRACNLKSTKGCMNFGDLLLYHGGAPADQERGRQYLQQICNLTSGDAALNANACFRYGRALEYGLGGAKDPVGATENYVRACAADDPDGCFYAGQMYAAGNGVAADNAAAKTYFEKACRLEGDTQCNSAKKVSQ